MFNMTDVTIVWQAGAVNLRNAIQAMLTARGLTWQVYNVAQAIANLNESTRLWIIFEWNPPIFSYWTTNLGSNGIRQGLLFVDQARHKEVQNAFVAMGIVGVRPCTVMIADHTLTRNLNSPYNTTQTGGIWDPAFDGGQVPTLGLVNYIECNESPLRPNMPYVCHHIDPTLNTDGDTIVGICSPRNAIPVADEYQAIDNAIAFCMGLPSIAQEITDTGLDMGIDLPFPFDWAEPIVNGFIALISGRGFIKIDIIGGIQDLFEPIVSFFSNPIGIITAKLNELFGQSSQEGNLLATEITDGFKHSVPERATALGKNLMDLAGFFSLPVDRLAELRDQINSGIAITDPIGTMNTFSTEMFQFTKLLFQYHGITESLSLGQFEYMGDLDDMVIQPTGAYDIYKKFNTLPFEKTVLKQAEYHYNTLYMPEIPDTNELINEVVKEVIPLGEFTRLMKNKGFNEVHSQRIWDAHFIAPSLGQLLTHYRRGRINAERLVELQILVDLDPRYNPVWLDQWYNDPSPRQGRWMFEDGSINYNRLRDIVVRAGLLPQDVDAFTSMLAKFQERPFKRSYIDQLGRGYRYDIYSADELRTSVTDAGYSEGVANWIIQEEDVRRKIEDSKEVTVKEKILSLGELKKGYLKDFLNEDELRTRLLLMNYDTSDVDLLITILNDDKVISGQATRKIALSVGEILQAWKQDVITEDDLIQRLLLRGMDLSEVNTLIETKRRQWGKVSE